MVTLPFLALFPFLLTGLLAMQASSRVVLSPPMAKWKAEIEASGKTTVVLARVFTDVGRNELVLPGDAEFRPFLRTLLESEPFVAQFVQTHAINVNANTGLRPISVVLLNMARAADWEGQEDSVIAHEFGHIWLHTRGYQAPHTAHGLSCEAVHAGDVVQHILIREQMRIRHIDFLPFWIRTLEVALHELNAKSEEHLQQTDPCQRISRLALWVDVVLSLSDENWSRRPLLLAAFQKSFPELEQPAMQIVTQIRGRNLHDRLTYQRVLRDVLFEIHTAAGPGSFRKP